MYSDELSKVLTDVLPLGLLILSEDDQVLVWNSAAAEITSISSNDIIGKHIHEMPERIKPLLDPSITELTITKEDFDSYHIQKTIYEKHLQEKGKHTIVIFSDVTDMINARQEMERLLMETSESKDLMEEQAAKLAMALAEVDEKSEIIQGQNKKMISELEMAGRLQKSLLPNLYENLGCVSFSSKYIPSIHIGGDLYDVVAIGQSLTGFIIADVSGHGVAAALVSSMFKMSFHALAATVASPKILFHMLNQEFNPILSEDYITSFYVITDKATNSITFSNAGHPTPLLFKKRTAEIIELDTDGFFLGMFEEGTYEEKTIEGIENGDALLLYTDCLLETENQKGNPFGMDRLKKLFQKVIQEAHGQDVIERIEAELRVFNPHEHFDDDFTVLLLEFWGEDDNLSVSQVGSSNIKIEDSGSFVEF